jgi:putative ABC transport system substrate-binding protein
MMRRREFIAGLGAAAWPMTARAQQPAVPVVAFLTNATFEGLEDRLRVFREWLRETGFVDGRNVAVEFHEAKGDGARLSALAAELVRRRVNVIVANGSAPDAARAATSTIPIVFLTGADPVELGYVASLNRPGGNLTGVTGLGDILGPKRLDLLHKVVPAATDIGVLVNPPNGSNAFQLRDLEGAAKILGLKLHVLASSTAQDFESVFESLVRMRAGGLVIATAPIFNNNLAKLGALASRHAIPAIYQYYDFAAGGGLIALGADWTEQYRWLAIYAGRILKGEKPSELPVQQATKIQLIFNTKTAKTLSLTIPETLLATADEVIQ